MADTAAPPAADVSLEFMSFSASAGGAGSGGGGAAAPAAALSSASGAGAAAGAGAGAGAGALGRSPLDENFSPLSLLSPAFYMACFDVDEADVVARVRAALWPFRPPQPFLALISAKPDLYGPVWISASLVFMIAVGFNMASWLNFRAATAVAPWEYDFKALTKALLLVYGFSFGAPAAVWIGMSYSLPKQLCLGLVSLTCVYGYSIAPFLPAAILCVIPSGAFQWLVVVAAIVISTAFTLQSTHRSVIGAMEAADSLPPGPSALAAKARARMLLLFIVGLQVFFGVVLKLFFFTFSG